MSTTPEQQAQQARDMLERMGVPDAQSKSSGDVVELANLIAGTSWKPTRWWRVMRDDRLWAETSSESEARSRMRRGDVLQRLWETEPDSEWRDADTPSDGT